MGDHASKDALDRAHETGVRDGKAGGDKTEPHTGWGYAIGGSQAQVEENDAYRRGHDAGTKQKSK
jgi:ribosome modulation factor